MKLEEQITTIVNNFNREKVVDVKYLLKVVTRSSLWTLFRLNMTPSSKSSRLTSLRSMSSSTTSLASLPSQASLLETAGSLLLANDNVCPLPTDNSLKNSFIPLSLNDPLSTTYFPFLEFTATIAG
ncbi:hypothetical protein BpHYR1_005454 [Brachionus plicatilis]|uniref:Uncharacterized protein n=1 Tax=Brachionus plicatilis TaxID=10195 RepID=A0A3M7S2R1_BRAPC|nr:hypothetical protein BpHYR1_005454 [Brachionus plicatilis]